MVVQIRLIVDLSQVEEYLSKEPNRLDEFVRLLVRSGETLANDIRANSPVRTGALRESIAVATNKGFRIEMNDYGYFIDKRDTKVKGWLTSILELYTSKLYRETVFFAKKVWSP